MKVNGVMVGSDSPHALGASYTSVLGKPAVEDGSWYGWGDDSTLMLGAYSEVHGENATPQRMMIMLEVADINGAFATMVGLDAKVIAEAYKPEPDREMWLATLEDPDGNYLQLVTPIEWPDDTRWRSYASLAAIEVAERKTSPSAPAAL